MTSDTINIMKYIHETVLSVVFTQDSPECKCWTLLHNYSLMKGVALVNHNISHAQHFLKYCFFTE